MAQFNWINGLDRTGWIAVGLFVAFFVITAITLVMMLKLNAENKKYQQKKSSKKSQPAASIRARAAPAKAAPVKVEPAKTEVKNTENKNDASNPLEEAKVFITYGLNKQAIDLLEKYLENNPSDKTAHEMLIKAQTDK